MTIKEAEKIFDENGYVTYHGKPYKIMGTDALHNTVTLPFGGPIGTVVKVSEIDGIK